MNSLFTKDGEVYAMDKLRFLIIGGAYSVDNVYHVAKFANITTGQMRYDNFAQK